MRDPGGDVRVAYKLAAEMLTVEVEDAPGLVNVAVPGRPTRLLTASRRGTSHVMRIEVGSVED